MNDETTKNAQDRVVSEDLSTADLAGKKQDIAQFRPAAQNEERTEIERAEDAGGAARIGGESEERAERGNVVAYRSGASAVAAAAKAEESGPLFPGDEANRLWARWNAIQAEFVDEPRQSVEQADHLVAGTMKLLAEIFAKERSKLESQWDRGENVSTEDLRQNLRRYRSFFSRLLSV
jgi:hypothetical protein